MIEIKVVREKPEEEVAEFNSLVVPQSVFDDVAELQQQMEFVNAALDGIDKRLSGEVLEAGQDLDKLYWGLYIIPTSAVASSLLNKPTTSNATGFIVVKQGGADGQKIMYYVPCSKDHSTYFQRAFYQGEWGSWKEVGDSDSGWIDLPLAAGITAYSDEQKPRYRKIGKTVYLSGVLKGITERDQVVAILPTGYRPTVKLILPVACVGQMFGKITINTNGTIVMNRTTVEPVLAENWHSIATSFCI